MILVAIWENDKEVISKIVRFKSELKDLKVDNKKPARIIVDQKNATKIGIHKLRNMISHTGLILLADGDNSKPLYDGRNKDNVRIKFT